MKKIFLLFIFLPSVIQSQTLNDLHSKENIRKFADYLFDEKDYLRAAYEYEKLKNKQNDTIEFKIALAYQYIENYDFALEKFSYIKDNSIFYNESRREYYKTLLQSGRYFELQNTLADKDKKDFQAQLYLSYLFISNELPEQNIFVNPFPSDKQKNILDFYNQKKNPPYKSSLLSGILSGLIPGSGKIYLGEIGDGITAFIATSLFAFLSYDNFNAKHDFRGWLFAGIGLFFYGGNIYGSIAAAQIYNARVDYEYQGNLKKYLQNENYFLPENEIAK